MAIAVTGATGLVGRHVVEALSLRGGRRVIATRHARPPYESIGTDWVQCDLRDPRAAMEALHGAEIAVFCAGQVSTSAVLRRDPMSSVLDSLRIGTSMLEAAARLRLPKVVLISSCTGYPARGDTVVEHDMNDGNPPAQWFGVGWMHRYLEKQLSWYVDHLRLIETATILRPTLVYGPYDDFSSDTGHFVPSLVRKVVERESPIEVWGDGNQCRNLLYAADLADAVVAVMTRAHQRLESFNVASPHDATINEVLEHLIDIDGFAEAMIVHDNSRSPGPGALAVSGVALAEATGWAARRTLRQGLAETVDWYRSSLS